MTKFLFSTLLAIGVLSLACLALADETTTTSNEENVEYHEYSDADKGPCPSGWFWNNATKCRQFECIGRSGIIGECKIHKMGDAVWSCWRHAGRSDSCR